MDNDIYNQSNADYGIYAARRIPKGLSGAASLAPAGSSLTDVKPNYVAIDFNYENVAASPALNITQKSYTVPKGRRAQIQGARAAISRVTAGGPNLFCSIFIAINRFGADPSHFEYIVKAQGIIAAAGTTINEISGFGVIDLFEGDTVTIQTSDNSVGGTLWWSANATLCEFDSSLNYAGAKATDPRFTPTQSAPAPTQGTVYPRVNILGGSSLGSGPINTNGFII